MFLAHSFRLRDPWQCEHVAGGGTRWSRLFHRPTGLEPDDQLVLVISGLPLSAEVTINGHELAPHHQYNVTLLLTDANQIEIKIPPLPPGLPPQASSLKPPFPYDARLAIVGRS